MAEIKKNSTPITPPMPNRAGKGSKGRPVEKPKDLKGTIKKIFKYINYSKTSFIFLIVIIVITTLLSVVAPIIQAACIESITPAQGAVSQYAFLQNIVTIFTGYEYDYSLGSFNGGQFFFPFLIMLAIVYFIQAICTYLQQRIAAYLSQTTVRKMRSDLFEKFVYLPIRFIDTHAHGDLMSRMTNDVENVSNTISQSLASLISGVLTIVGTLIIMFYYNWLLTLLSLVFVGITIVLSRLLTKKMTKYYRKRSSLLGKLNGHIEEMITGYKTVTAYNRCDEVQDTFDEISSDYAKTSIIGEIWGGSMGPIMNFVGNLSYLMIAISGALIMLNSPFGLTISIGTISLFLTSSKQLTRPINQIANLFGQMITAVAGAERVFEILEADSEIDNGTLMIDDNRFKGDIEFKHVNFGYVENQTVLKDFSLSIKHGEKIALVGATGSGKTTIVNLLMRFYDVNSGSILIDGVNIEDIKKEELRTTTAIVLQDTVLFKDTIEKNIKYGKIEASKEEVKNAAILSNANYFVKKLPNRYDTMLSEGGSNLSQGQRQLLSIARAILANPKILILDEATSSVDTRTEKNIQDAMNNLMKNRTSLIIAHRLSTIQDADKIVVIDRGEIVETGNHEELLNKKGKYYDLYMTQFAGKAI